VPLDHLSQSRHHSSAADPGGHRGRPSAPAEPAAVRHDHRLADQYRLPAPARLQPDQPLLALHRFSALGVGYSGYIRLALWPGLAAIAATVAVLAVIHLGDLRGHYLTEAPPAAHDRTLLIIALGPAFVSGIAPAIPASVAALVLIGTLLVRNRPLLREVKVPWLIVLGVSALFIAVDLALGHGLRELLAGWVGTGADTSDLLRVSAFGAGTANVADNLPAYLALESVTDNDPHLLMALLIGV